MLGGEVQNDEDRRFQIGRELPDERSERFDAAGRSADDDDVAMGHSGEGTPFLAD